MQFLWDIYSRDQDLWKKTALEILGELGRVMDLRFIIPMKEKDSRWLTNGRAAKHVLMGYYITDEDGTPFWVLLAIRLIYIYKDSDWRVKRLNAFCEWLCMPEMIFGLWVEAEVVEYFEWHYHWHAQCGELSDRPGFRTLELFFEIADHAFPFWSRALKDPRSCFPNAIKHIEEEMEAKSLEMLEAGDEVEAKRLDSMAKMKRAQLKEGIEAAHNELAKMNDKFFVAPWVFLCFICPIRGRIVLRVCLALMKEAGVDLDAVYDDEEHLIDKTLDWDLLHAPELPCATYTAYYDKLKGDKAELCHFFQQLGLWKSHCRNELKLFSQGREIRRDPDSKTRVLDFAKAWPCIFDKLWAEFALTPSASRIAEAFHGMFREAFDPQTTHDFADGRGRYLLWCEYEFRSARRDVINEIEMLGEDVQKRLKKRATKHNDRSCTQIMAGKQVKDQARAKYTELALKKRFPKEVYDANTITANKKKGTTTLQKQYVEKVVEHGNDLMNKKRSKVDYKEMDLGDFIASARNVELDNDKRYRNGPHLDKLANAKTLMTQSYWKKIKVEDGLFEDVKRVFPVFWKLYTKELGDKKPRKGAMLAFSGTYKTSLMMFCQHVVDISKGKKENDLSSAHRSRQLERAGMTEDLLLLEFIKVDKSVTLKKSKKDETEKYSDTRAIIESTGTTIASQAQGMAGQNGGFTIEKRTISYRLPSVNADADEELFGDAAMMAMEEGLGDVDDIEDEEAEDDEEEDGPFIELVRRVQRKQLEEDEVDDSEEEEED